MIRARFLAALLALAALASTPARAQDALQTPALTPDQFEAYVTGKTLTWSLGPQIWGTEEYLPGRQVQWATAPDECLIGTWYGQGDQICFDYDGNESSACWIFRLGPSGLLADLQGPKAPLMLSESGQDPGGLPCPGPDLGV